MDGNFDYNPKSLTTYTRLAIFYRHFPTQYERDFQPASPRIAECVSRCSTCSHVETREMLAHSKHGDAHRRRWTDLACTMYQDSCPTHVRALDRKLPLMHASIPIHNPFYLPFFCQIRVYARSPVGTCLPWRCHASGSLCKARRTEPLAAFRSFQAVPNAKSIFAN